MVLVAALTPYRRAIRDGVRAAQREHQRLGTDLTTRIEIFDIIEDARIWVWFARLGVLYGAYKRFGDAWGIIINSQHPLTVQRYTGAHEYGHHVLGHVASADDDERIQRSPQDLREVAAQAFAGEFLMPLQLVNRMLRIMGFAGSNLPLTARQIYQLSLEVGFSYRAMVTQLEAQHKLTRGRGRHLLQQSPIDLKTSLVGVRPAYPWADVWLLDESQEGRPFSPRLRDEVHVMLSETPSTGYVWQLVDPAAAVLALTNDSFEIADDAIIGASGTRHVAFRVAEPGTSRIRLEKRRPWQQNGGESGTFEATLKVIPLLTGDADVGLPEDQKEALVAGGRAA